MKEIIKALHNQKLLKLNGHNYVVNPITDHYPETDYKLLNDMVDEFSKLTDFSKANKIVGEEDRGGYLAGLMAFKHKKSLAMTKWYPSNIKEKTGIKFQSAVVDGEMYLHGVKKGDKIILVEDLIDTGGTIIGMIKLLKKAKVKILDVVCIGVKQEYNGVSKIKQEIDIDVKYLVEFTCTGKKSKVVKIKGKNYS